MNASTRRLIVGSLGAALACVLMAGAWLAANALRIGLGHKARTLCSGVFVSRLDPAVVLTDPQADDLAVLKWINASIDFRARSVKTTFGTIASQAVYREGLGCILVLDGLIPPALPEGQGARQVAALLKGALPGSTAGLVAADSGSPRTDRVNRVRRLGSSSDEGQSPAVSASDEARNGHDSRQPGR